MALLLGYDQHPSPTAVIIVKRLAYFLLPFLPYFSFSFLPKLIAFIVVPCFIFIRSQIIYFFLVLLLAVSVCYA